MTKRKVYDEDFKKSIVELYSSKNKTSAELIREYGMSSSTLYQWINDYHDIETDDGQKTNYKEIEKMKKELKRTKEELDILKKAIAIFTQK